MGKGMWAKFFAHIGKGENAAGWRETDPRVPVDENGVAVKNTAKTQRNRPCCVSE